MIVMLSIPVQLRERRMFVCALACDVAHSHVHGMMMITYGARFDFDGWMVIDTAVVNGELVSEAVRRGLSFGEATHLADSLNVHGIGRTANQN